MDKMTAEALRKIDYDTIRYSAMECLLAVSSATKVLRELTNKLTTLQDRLLPASKKLIDDSLYDKFWKEKADRQEEEWKKEMGRAKFIQALIMDLNRCNEKDQKEISSAIKAAADKNERFERMVK